MVLRLALSFALCLACFLPATPALADRVFTALTAAETAELDANRARVAQYLAVESKPAFGTAAGKLDTLRAIVASGVLEPYSDDQIAAIGTVFGDAFVLDLGMHWVRVRDTIGTTIGLRYKDTSILLAPIDIMFRRADEIRNLDFVDLYVFYATTVQEMAAKGM